jgi:hypothetical protein
VHLNRIDRVARAVLVWQNRRVVRHRTRLRHRLSLLLAPSVVLAWSCATATDAPSRDFDPNIPEVDASWTPQPKKPGGAKGPGSTSGSAPEPGSVETSDAGADTGTHAPTPPPTFSPGTPRAARGDVVITEVMFDPTGPEPASEWIEIWNGKSSARSLAGLTLRDGAGRTHLIAGAMGEVAVAPDRYVVLVRDRAAAIASGVPADAIVYEYGAGLTSSEGIQLANGASGAIAVFDGESEITSVAYGSHQFTNVDGRSAQADTQGNWSLAPATPGIGPQRQ